MQVAAQIETDRTYDELKRLFGIYRLSNLNVRYYGCRTKRLERWIQWSNIAAGALSAIALSLLLADVAHAKYWAAGLAGVAGVLTAVSPLFGWTEKARECRTLHFSYGQVFNQIELVIAEIRRQGVITEQLVGAAKMVHEAYMRLDAIDEPDPDQKVIDREDAKVRKAFPDDYLWTNF